MEYIFSCEICSEDYNNISTIPKVLTCGHSFCSPCITKINNSICPKCRAHLHGKKEFPINYLILNVIDECKSAKNLIPDIMGRIQDLRKEMSTRLTTIKKVISEKSTQQENIEKDLESLKSLEAEDLNQDSLRSDVRKKLSVIEKRYPKELSLATNSEFVDDTNRVCDFSLKKSRANDVFLKEVYKTLQKFEKVYAFKRIDAKLKFGKLTVRDNNIHIHSLSLDEPPEDSKTVPFVDLKEACKEKTLRTFIEISGKNDTSHMVIINLQDKKFCPHFIQLCTGENGPSYKNCAYRRNVQNGASGRYDGYDDIYDYYDDYDLEYRKKQKISSSNTAILFVDTSKCLPVDYYKNLPSNVKCVENEVIVTERPKDGFQLSRVHGAYNFSIMGKVSYPLNIWEYVNDSSTSPCKILDCGIVMEL